MSELAELELELKVKYIAVAAVAAALSSLVSSRCYLYSANNVNA